MLTLSYQQKLKRKKKRPKVEQVPHRFFCSLEKGTGNGSTGIEAAGKRMKS